MADMIFDMRKTHRNLETSSEVLALTHQFAKDDCALAKAAGTNLDLILGGQGKWGFGRLRPCYTIHVHHVHHVLVLVFFFLLAEVMICPKISSFG